MGNIRPAHREDMPQILAFIKELAEFERLAHQAVGTVEMLEEDFDRNAFWCFLIEVQGKPVGFTLGYRTYSTFQTRPGIWMEDLYVQPAHRGTGLGKAMLLHVIEMAKAEGAGRIEWSVLDWNQTAIDFYEAMGANLMHDWRNFRIVLPVTG